MTALQREERFEKKQRMWNEAYDRAQRSMSMSNYVIIIKGFATKGIPEDQIIPRVNVLTYNAWKAQGRYVRKGEHGISIPVVFNDSKQVDGPEYDEDENLISEGKTESFRILTGATVFHISQTEEMKGR